MEMLWLTCYNSEIDWRIREVICKNNKMSRGIQEAVKTSTGEVRLEETERRRSKRKSRKKKKRKENRKKEKL